MKIFSKRIREDYKSLNNSLLRSRENPFASTVYERKKPVKFFIGRDEEIKRILQVVQTVLKQSQSKGIILKGPGGCGKSTLFGFINQIIRQGRVIDFPRFNLDTRSFSIIPTYIDAPSNSDTFLKLWPAVFEGLEERDYSFFEYLCFLFIAKLFKVFQDDSERQKELTNIIWSKRYRIPSHLQDSNFKSISWRDILDLYLLDHLSSQIPLLISFTKQNARKIVRHSTVVHEIDSPQASIITLDRIHSIGRLENLLQVIGEDTTVLDSIFYVREKNNIISNDDDGFEWFNFLANLYTWTTGTLPCFLVGIDEIGKVSGGLKAREAYYQGFFNTLIRMRNRLNYVVFVLIGTTDDWRNMENFVEGNFDLYAQIQGFLMEKIDLRPLEPELAVQVFKNRIEDYWKREPIKPRFFRWYPFSEELFSYVYYYTGNQIRESLILLNRLWTENKLNQRVKHIPNYILSMTAVRSIEKDWPKDFLVKSFHEFERKILLNDFWSKNTFKTDLERSKFCEESLTTGFTLLAKHDRPRYVDRARCNPKFTLNVNGKNRNRYPDVYVEFFGQLGPERSRNVEFQIKIYKEDSSVSQKDLKSSFQLLEAGFTDLLYLIMTGSGLDQEAKRKVIEFGNRIMGLQPLNEDQLLALILLSRYRELTGKELSVKISKALIEIALNQPWENFIADLRTVPKNPGTGLIKKPEIIQFLEKDKIRSEKTRMEKKDIKPILEKVPEVNKLSEQIQEHWIKKFPPDLVSYKKEIVYLFDKVLSRKGRWSGQISLNFLIKDIPAEISKPKLRKLFKTISKETRYFTSSGSSIFITDEGRTLGGTLK